MIELLTIAPLSAILWLGVIKWVRYLDTRDLLEGLHATAADAALIDAAHPTVMVRR